MLRASAPGRGVARAAIFGALVTCAGACTALLGISDPVDEGGPATDTGVDDGLGPQETSTDAPPDADAHEVLVDAPPVESDVSCAALADGTVCATSPRAICLKGACVTSVCGDHFTDPGRGEECDDANAVDGDGCDGDCTFSCSSPSKPSKTCSTSFCAPSSCSGHACIPGSNPCPPPVSCKTVACDEGTRTCGTPTLIDGDGDGYGPASMPAAAPCNDCDDGDKDVHPGQSAYFTAPRPGGGFDYDCDGVIEPQSTVGSCALNAGSTGCDVVVGYESSLPACGSSGPYIIGCLFDGSTCSTQYEMPDPTLACH